MTIKIPKKLLLEIASNNRIWISKDAKDNLSSLVTDHISKKLISGKKLAKSYGKFVLNKDVLFIIFK